MQTQQLWESIYGGDYGPAFINPQGKEWFIISKPKKGFWVNTCHIVSSLSKSQAYSKEGSIFQGW